MTAPIVYIDRSNVRPGKLEEARSAAAELVEVIESLEPQLLHYGFYFDEAGSRMTVVAVHPDPASVELHMDVGTPLFRAFAELVDMQVIEIFGEPSERMLEQLEAKAAMLGDNGSVVVDRQHAGFRRW